MGFWNAFRSRLQKNTDPGSILAGLCIARADGSNPSHPASEKHALLVMVKSESSNAECAIHQLLESYGWKNAEIHNLKVLDKPFVSDDPAMHDCYKGAISGDGGIIIYADPILDA